MPVIPALGKLRWENQESEDSLDSIATPYHIKQKLNDSANRVKDP
jgi:hypothetical protein